MSEPENGKKSQVYMREETGREQGPPLDGVGRNDLESTTLHRRGDTFSEI